MAATPRDEIAKCKQRIALVRTLIDEQRTCGLSTESAGRASWRWRRTFLTLLQDALAAEGGAADEGASG